MRENKYLIAAKQYVDESGYTEELTEANFVIPNEEDYMDFGEETEEWDIAANRPGLWENIRRKKQREGDNYRPAKPGDPDRPTPEQLKRAQSYVDAYADHAEADKPGPKDPRRTPAPKKDQKRGSKKNKKKSAEKPNKNIKFSKEVTQQLSNKVKEHNAKGKGSKATLGMLKAVYRRGAGAYSSSHAPKMSRHGWAIARVNAFLTLLRTGKPSNSAYKQDNDLLPKGHPRAKSYVYVKPEDSKAEYVYENPRTGETFRYNRKGAYKKDGEILVFRGKAEMSEKQKKALDKNKDGKVDEKDFELMRKGKNKSDAAEYQGRKVTLNKPFRTPDGPKKSSVYVKNEKGNVVKVNFGDPNMEIKRDNPKRRKSFRARHNCSNPGPKWKARYWSCKAW